MAGTGAASLADAVVLTRAAFDCGLSAALVMPPFFFREVGDDAILSYFNALFARTNPRRQSILLYNFPRMSGIAFSIAAGRPARRRVRRRDCRHERQLERRAAASGRVGKASASQDLPRFGERFARCQKTRRGGLHLGQRLALAENLLARFSPRAKPSKPKCCGKSAQRSTEFRLFPRCAILRRPRASEPAWLRPMPPQPALTLDERAEITSARKRLGVRFGPSSKAGH